MNFFITGGAGSGKTMVFSLCILDIMRQLGRFNVITLAYFNTVASANNGLTVNKFFCLNNDFFESIDKIINPNDMLSVVNSQEFNLRKESTTRYEQIKTLEVIFIDECQLFSKNSYIFLDLLIRKIRNKEKDISFGGVKLILCGDIIQKRIDTIGEYIPFYQTFETLYKFKICSLGNDSFRQRNYNTLRLVNLMREGTNANAGFQQIYENNTTTCIRNDGLTFDNLFGHKMCIDPDTFEILVTQSLCKQEVDMVKYCYYLDGNKNDNTYSKYEAKKYVSADRNRRLNIKYIEYRTQQLNKIIVDIDNKSNKIPCLLVCIEIKQCNRVNYGQIHPKMIKSIKPIVENLTKNKIDEDRITNAIKLVYSDLREILNKTNANIQSDINFLNKYPDFELNVGENEEDSHLAIFKIINNSYLDKYFLPKNALVKVLEVKECSIIVQQLQMDKKIFTPKVEIKRMLYKFPYNKDLRIELKFEQYPLRRSDAITVEATVGYTFSGINLIFNNQWGTHYVNNYAYIFASRSPDIENCIPIFPIVKSDCKQTRDDLSFMLKHSGKVTEETKKNNEIEIYNIKSSIAATCPSYLKSAAFTRKNWINEIRTLRLEIETYNSSESFGKYTSTVTEEDILLTNLVGIEKTKLQDFISKYYDNINVMYNDNTETHDSNGTFDYNDNFYNDNTYNILKDSEVPVVSGKHKLDDSQEILILTKKQKKNNSNILKMNQLNSRTKQKEIQWKDFHGLIHNNIKKSRNRKWNVTEVYDLLIKLTEWGLEKYNYKSQDKFLMTLPTENTEKVKNKLKQLRKNILCNNKQFNYCTCERNKNKNLKFLKDNLTLSETHRLHKKLNIPSKQMSGKSITKKDFKWIDEDNIENIVLTVCFDYDINSTIVIYKKKISKIISFYL
jgi:hypothetical protein